jgi:hypothetical protein
LFLALAAACANSAVPAGCFRLPDHSIDSLSLAEDGHHLAVGTTDYSTGEEVVWTYDVRAGEISEVARSFGIAALFGVSHGPSGVSWITVDGRGLGVWAADPDPDLVMILHRDLIELTETERGYIALDITDDEEPVVVWVQRESDDNRRGSVALAFHPVGTISESFDMSSDGRRIVYEIWDPDRAVTTFVFGDVESPEEAVEMPGRLIGNPSIDDRTGEIYYENHDDGTLKRLDPDTGSISTVLPDEVSTIDGGPGGVGARTFTDPRRTDQFCVTQIGSVDTTSRW